MEQSSFINASKMRALMKEKMHSLVGTGGGKLLFSEKDVMESSDMMARILRSYCVENKITSEQLVEQYRKYGEEIGLTQDQISQGIGNVRRAFTADDVTKKSFIKFCAIMNIDILGVAITLKNRDGKIATYDLNTVYPEIDNDVI